MKETKAYKTYLGFAIRATPPKKVQKFKKPASPKLTTVLASTEEPTGKSKRVKRPAKKSTQVDVARGKGIELLSDVALTKEAQYEEVRKKSLRDFHKTHPSGSGIATKPTLSAVIIKPSVTNEGTGVKPGVPNVTSWVLVAKSISLDAREKASIDIGGESHLILRGDRCKLMIMNRGSESRWQGEMPSERAVKSESGSEFNQEEDDEKIEDDEEEEEEEIVKTPSNNSDDEDETKIADKAEGEEDKEMDYTTSLLYDDVDIRMNEQVDADKGFVQEEDTDVTMTNIKQRE
ncbi:hypothetical protein Tco_1061996 [Tanacetum coccineum]